MHLSCTVGMIDLRLEQVEHSLPRRERSIKALSGAQLQTHSAVHSGTRRAGGRLGGRQNKTNYLE